jgi:glycosyltransferase involved in cell wall biosynthesis
LTKRYPCLDGKAVVSRNGIEPSFFTGEEVERKPWVVFSSSPDRGLDVLLECWPQVKERVPEAELHHTYAPVYGMMRKTRPDLDAFHRQVERLAAQCEGVVRHEGLGQQQLAKLYQESKVWAYPSWHSMGGAAFPEIFCISAVEAQAGGCVPVHLDYAALQEVVVCGEAIPGPATSETFRKRFVDAIVRGLTDEAWRKREAVKGRTHALGLDWEGVVDDWERALLKREPTEEREAA